MAEPHAQRFSVIFLREGCFLATASGQAGLFANQFTDSGRIDFKQLREK
jgi:hypothetical protein